MRVADSPLVECSLVFTRAHFAMLAKRSLLPDRRSDWPLPKNDEPGYNSSLLGFKLSCGFELLKRQAEAKGPPPSLPDNNSLLHSIVEEVVEKELALDASFLVRCFLLRWSRDNPNRLLFRRGARRGGRGRSTWPSEWFEATRAVWWRGSWRRR